MVIKLILSYVTLFQLTLFFRFYNCVNGVAYELPCATSLVFDEAEGTCVRPEQASEFAKKCKVPDEKRKNTLFIQII